jgi:hypothetical protein
MRKTGAAKFVEFVNKNIGKALTTGLISKKSEVHMRRVQSFCKAIRGTRKVSSTQSKRSFVYTFKKTITAADIK